jgi:hypothetical protein
MEPLSLATTPEPNPTSLFEHAAWHGMLSIWPQLVVSGTILLGLMIR